MFVAVLDFVSYFSCFQITISLYNFQLQFVADPLDYSVTSSLQNKRVTESLNSFYTDWIYTHNHNGAGVSP